MRIKNNFNMETWKLHSYQFFQYIMKHIMLETSKGISIK